MKRNVLTGRRVTVALLLAYFASTGFSQAKNGFDLSNAVVPENEIILGGPPRDGIPSIDNPKFIPASAVTYLKDDDIVIGLVEGGQAQAYPHRILIWHEVVNDTFAGESVMVTYCPLCGTGMVFSREIKGKERTFGVSGLLYQSDVLMYDRESESLWSQLGMKAISGPHVGTQLKWLRSEHMTWKAWRQKYPESQVLSTETGYQRDYGGSAYNSYFKSEKTMFPVPHTRKELPNKEWVIGVIINGQASAYPISDLPSGDELTDTVGGETISVSYNAKRKHPVVTGSEGRHIPSVLVFWFAWQAFYPETELWRP